MILIDWIERIVRAVLVSRIRRIAGIVPVHGIECAVGIIGVGLIERVVRLVLRGRVEDVVVPLVSRIEHHFGMARYRQNQHRHRAYPYGMSHAISPIKWV